MQATTSNSFWPISLCGTRVAVGLPASDVSTLGNPPYTRSQLIPMAMRTRLHEQSGRALAAHLRASLSAYITAIALQGLEPNDGICLLLPAQWLESDYARGIRRHLLRLTNRRVDLRLAPAGLFKDATVDAVVLLVGTERDVSEPFTVSKWDGEVVLTVNRAQQGDAGWREWF